MENPMTKDLYDSLDPKEKAFIDYMILLVREVQKTNTILEEILKADA